MGVLGGGARPRDLASVIGVLVSDVLEGRQETYWLRSGRMSES